MHVGRPLLVSPENVLKELRKGARSMWDLGPAFDVPSGYPLLEKTVRGLIAVGVVTASDSKLYTATLKVVEPS